MKKAYRTYGIFTGSSEPTYASGNLEGKNRKTKGKNSLFKPIVTENFSDLEKENEQIYESQRIPKRSNIRTS
jgi:hypothetical protein